MTETSEPLNENLSSLEGVAMARERLYNRLMAGQVPDSRANVGRGLLKDQEFQQAALPMQFIRTIGGVRGPALESYKAQIITRVMDFFEGTKSARALDFDGKIPAKPLKK